MCRDPRNQFRAWGGGGKCAPQSRAYPTITGDEGGNNEALSRRCALRIQNKRWRRRHGWIIRTRVPGGGRLRGGSPPLCLEPDESAPQTSVKHRRFQQDNELFCSGERFHSVLSSVLTGEGGGQKNRGRGYLTLSLFPSPFARRERERERNSLPRYDVEGRRCIVGGSFISLRDHKARLPRSPFNLMSHIMRHMERNFRHDTVRITRIRGGSDDIYRFVYTRIVDRSYSRRNGFLIRELESF